MGLQIGQNLQQPNGVQFGGGENTKANGARGANGDQPPQGTGFPGLDNQQGAAQQNPQAAQKLDMNAIFT